MINAAVQALQQFGYRRLLKGLAMVTAILAVGYVAKNIDFGGWARWIDFNDRPDALWYQGKVGYLAITALIMAVGAPRQIVSFFAAYFFGLLPGFLIGMAAVTSSCLIAASAARLFRSQAQDLITGRIDLALDFWRQQPFSTSAIIRMMPVGSNLLTNTAAGVSGIPMLPFVAGSFVGYIPQMAVFALMGSGVDVGANWQIALGVASFVILSIFSFWMYRKYRSKISAKPAK